MENPTYKTQTSHLKLIFLGRKSKCVRGGISEGRLREWKSLWGNLNLGEWLRWRCRVDAVVISCHLLFLLSNVFINLLTGFACRRWFTTIECFTAVAEKLKLAVENCFPGISTRMTEPFSIQLDQMSERRTNFRWPGYRKARQRL